MLNAPFMQQVDWGAGNRKVAAPSWVFAGSILENCQFLAGKVHEVALLFLESASSLAYGKEDLPVALKALPLSYHVHLPVDLPWHDGAAAAKVALTLMEKVAFLDANQAVLHPAVGGSSQFLRNFVRVWQQGGRNPHDIYVENILGCDLLCLEQAIVDLEVQVCLDIGHFLAYGQHNLLFTPWLLERVGMIHVNAPGGAEKLSRHMPLVSLSLEHMALVQKLLLCLPSTATIVWELFCVEHIETSVPLMREWMLQKKSC